MPHEGRQLNFQLRSTFIARSPDLWRLIPIYRPTSRRPLSERAQFRAPFAPDFGVNGQTSARVGRRDLVLFKVHAIYATALGNRKCVSEHFDIRRLAALNINTHNVEAERRIAFDLAQKFARHAGEIALLLRVNRRFSRHDIARGAGLYLDEAQRAP